MKHKQIKLTAYIKAKAIKLLEVNMRESFFNLGLGKCFLDKTQEIPQIKKELKIEKIISKYMYIYILVPYKIYCKNYFLFIY